LTDTASLSPEHARAEWSDLDLRSTVDLVRLWTEEETTVARAIADAQPALVAAVDMISSRVDAGGRLIYVGAGTPGRLAWLDAVECPPTFGCAPDLVQAVIAGGAKAFSSAIEADEDDADTAAAALTGAGLRAADTLVCVSASGRTPFVLAAAAFAREAGARTVALVNAPGSALAGACDLAVEVLTGPEILAGSSRLKAGTAQKVVLNMFSTLLMMRLGHTYGNLMVGVHADNIKLRERTRRIVEQATGAAPEAVEEMVERCGGDLKLSIVALLTGDDLPAARDRLDKARRRVRQAVSAS
jgi:N-acetylmuramic acid 6-phosphate etherase